MLSNYLTKIKDSKNIRIVITIITIMLLLVIAVFFTKNSSVSNMFSSEISSKSIGISGKETYSKEELRKRDIEAETRKQSEIKNLNKEQYEKGQDFVNKFSETQGTFIRNTNKVK